MLRIAVIEDNSIELEHLQNCLKRYGMERNILLEIAVFGDASDFLAHYRASYDLVFMDIELPGINGIEAAHRLRKLDQQVALVFVTNMAQFAVKGYEVDALDYIIKPVQYTPLSIKLNRVVARQGAAAESIMIEQAGGTARLLLREILYIEVRGHKLTYHTDQGEVSAGGSLQETEKRLRQKGFLRCNKCYLVNQRHIRQVHGCDILLSTGETIQISRLRRKEFLEELSQSMGNELIL